MNAQVDELKRHEDERGFLVEFLKGIELVGERSRFGQVYLTTINPGFIRGNHYHERFSEYVTVMHGRIRLLLEDIKTNERLEMILDAKDAPLKRVRYGPYTAHALQNISDSVAVVVSYATEVYDKVNVDQVTHPILRA